MGRDHSVECPTCGTYYGGFTGPEFCPLCTERTGDGLSDLEGGVDDERHVIERITAERDALAAEVEMLRGDIQSYVLAREEKQAEVMRLRQERDHYREKYLAGLNDDSGAAEVERLRQENDKMHAARDQWLGNDDACFELERTVDRLRGALRRYGRHDIGCPAGRPIIEYVQADGSLVPSHIAECRCGLDAALAPGGRP